jgi:hypothetical protein
MAVLFALANDVNATKVPVDGELLDYGGVTSEAHIDWAVRASSNVLLNCCENLRRDWPNLNPIQCRHVVICSDGPKRDAVCKRTSDGTRTQPMVPPLSWGLQSSSDWNESR